MPLVMAQTFSRAANDLKQAVNLRANMIRSFALNLQVCKMNQKQITQEETLLTQGSQSLCVYFYYQNTNPVVWDGFLC